MNLNGAFINKIFLEMKASFMQSKTEDFTVELEAVDTQKSYPRNFRLYEEYSKKNIVETIRTRRENFDKADSTIKRELENKVEREVTEFRAWLEENKNFEPNAAHYYSISLKSLLLGLPVGVQVARLFGIILDVHTRE